MPPSIRLINEPIEPVFLLPPLLEKRPTVPSAFIWRNEHLDIVEVLEEWSDYRRRGRMANNMQPAHARVAARRGSWGVGEFHFKVRTSSDRIFDIYYDRAPKNAGDRKGSWFVNMEFYESSDLRK